MNKAILALGSNTGDRKQMLSDALQGLGQKAKIVLVSDVYETFLLHGDTLDPFLNCCVEIETELTSLALMNSLGDLQHRLNGDHDRERFQRFTIDLDLIAFNDELLRTPKLTLPHPEAHRRAFVMIPLAQIKPDWVHPVLKKTATLLAKEAFWPGWGSFFAHGNSLLDF